MFDTPKSSSDGVAAVIKSQTHLYDNFIFLVERP